MARRTEQRSAASARCFSACSSSALTRTAGTCSVPPFSVVSVYTSSPCTSCRTRLPSTARASSSDRPSTRFALCTAVLGQVRATAHASSPTTAPSGVNATQDGSVGGSS